MKCQKTNRLDIPWHTHEKTDIWVILNTTTLYGDICLLLNSLVYSVILTLRWEN